MNKDIEKVVGDDAVNTSMSKLRKDKVEVNINPQKFLLENSIEELKKLEEQDVSTLTDSEKELVETMKKNYKDNIEKYTNAKRIEGYLTPLKFSDNLAKRTLLSNDMAVLEKEFSHLSEQSKIMSMIREEHFLTVFFSLKKKDNLNERFYKNLDEIALETDSAITELYNMYNVNFVLSDAERKNL